LLDNMSDQLLFLNGRGQAEFFADYDQWLTAQAAEAAQKTLARTPPKHRRAAPRKLPYPEQCELNRMQPAIEKAEAAAAAMRGRLDDPLIASDAVRLGELYAELTEAEEKVRRLYDRWAELEALQERLGREG
jgi:ATP-binding cassette subfamily F protein uup